LSRSRPTARRLAASAARDARTAAAFGEMAVAAGRTIAARTAMMSAAGTDPVAWSDPEFRLMASEKAEAAVAARLGMAAGERAAVAAATAWWQAHAAAGLRLAGALAEARTPAAGFGAWTAWATRVADINVGATVGLAEAMGGMAAGALVPVRRTAMANAKRLG
jgi:hypothetical protein